MSRLAALGVLAAVAFGLLTVAAWRRLEPLASLDIALHSWAITARNDTTVACARAVTQAGSTYVAVPIILCAGWLAAPTHKPMRRLATATVLAAVAALGAAAGLAMNAAVNAVRPGEEDWLGAAGGPTYPSGHTTVATLLAGALAWAAFSRWGHSGTGRAAAIIATASALAAVVGISRVWLGVHWPSDVLGGWLFGLAWAALAVELARAVRRRRSDGPTSTEEHGGSEHRWREGTPADGGP